MSKQTKTILAVIGGVVLIGAIGLVVVNRSSESASPNRELLDRLAAVRDGFDLQASIDTDFSPVADWPCDQIETNVRLLITDLELNLKRYDVVLADIQQAELTTDEQAESSRLNREAWQLIDGFGPTEQAVEARLVACDQSLEINLPIPASADATPLQP